MTHAYDGYTTNLPLEEALKDDVLLVHTAEGRPLPAEHGGPVRIITPQLYAWKGAKWIHRIELLTATASATGSCAGIRTPRTRGETIATRSPCSSPRARRRRGTCSSTCTRSCTVR